MQTHTLSTPNHQLPPTFCFFDRCDGKHWVLEHNLREQWGKIWASWRLVANPNEMLERLVTQDSLQYFTSCCHPTAGRSIKSNTLFLLDKLTHNLSTLYASWMWNDKQAEKKKLKSIVFCFFVFLNQHNVFKFMCFIPVSCDVIVYMNTNAAVFDLNSVTKCPVRPNFMRCVSMSKLKNKK